MEDHQKRGGELIADYEKKRKQLENSFGNYLTSTIASKERCLNTVAYKGSPVFHLYYLCLHGYSFGLFITRFGSILWSTSVELVGVLNIEKYKTWGPIYYYLFNTLLLCLLVLHIYWWVLIYRMLIKQIQDRGKISEDVRSDSDSDHEHED